MRNVPALRHQFPGKRLLHQPLKQQPDLASRLPLLFAKGLHLLDDPGELLLEVERGKGDFQLF